MDHFDVDLLDAVGVAKVRHANFNIGGACHFAAVFAGQGDHFHPLRPRGFNGFDHVAGIARSGDTKQHIARAANGFNVAGKHILIAKIIAHAGEMADVGDRDGRITRAVFAITSCQLFRKMHRIAMGTTVTAGQHFTTRLKAIRQQDSGTLDSMDIGFVLQKVSQRFRGFVQFVTNKILVHEDNPSV
ncbi:conserved hypothetical protein [Klebsiella variicola]|nr:conserved hypothetical protein [Klebsiella variicola]